MITIEKEFEFSSTYPLSRLGSPDRLLFFDIETTGFSADYNTVYLIGCVYLKGESFRLIQWFADTKDSEADVLDSFFEFLKGFDTLVHFNGDMFDIPFLSKRCLALGLPYTFSGLSSIDIYRRVKPYKKHLGLANLKQKSIEAFLGIAREDLYNGGELIKVYETYLKNRDEELLHLLLLHNEDDLKGMPALLPILSYPDFFSQEFRLTDMVRAAGETNRVLLTLEGDKDSRIPVPLKASVPAYTVMAKENRLVLSIRLYEGTLKYFYPNYRDYFYLIYEDTAIHKSVGEYVDKGARVKATKETCYTKKKGLFLPQPTPVWTPEFKNSCRDKTCFFEFDPACFSDSEKLSRYAKDVMAFAFSG